ncbi:MAG: ECF-type sigma factor, partial [Wenzhouxiangellaceae bacterium]
QEVTRLLDQVRRSEAGFSEVIRLVYDDLHRIGHAQRLRLNAGPTMQTTALVNEAFLKLQRHGGKSIRNRKHFKRLAALVMRQLIFDYARRGISGKRGGGQADETLNENRVAGGHAHDGPDDDPLFVLEIERAMQQLEQASPRLAEVVSARFFAGYTLEEIAEVLEISPRTVSRDLNRALAWLKVELEENRHDEA